MITLNQEQTLKLELDELAAAGEFWAYPDAEWQKDFQASWLEVHMGVSTALRCDGVLVGEDEEKYSDQL